jgi:hypothetical protein
LIVAPKCLELDEARREIRKVLKAANITVEELVEALKMERERPSRGYIPFQIRKYARTG